MAVAEELAERIQGLHGDPPAVEWMRAKLLNELPDVEVIIPAPGIELEL